MLRVDTAVLWQEGWAVVSPQCNQDCALHEAVLAALSPPALQVTIAVSFDTSFPLNQQSPLLKNGRYCLLFVHLTIGSRPDSWVFFLYWRISLLILKY